MKMDILSSYGDVFWKLPSSSSQVNTNLISELRVKWIQHSMPLL
ncbi:high mobility group nucleosomal binding domain 3, isoform CRA_d [Rattus norvegicus]|uniref:High mobility group nucleosomal binding domain 3, isoform CRA_d n=1 Tax=Rattus norvegicus TaxID=10116 RepID=A6I1Q7_RAT|nr:high mobility group nucleosomal binding domain 3, isoform CRA_d [Rattus norvegicus]